MEFKEASGAIGQLIFKEQDNRTLKRKGLIEVPCFPLETMLLAINRTHVDYFSLDVEGFELDVLKTIPFDRVSDIPYHVHLFGARSSLTFMNDAKLALFLSSCSILLIYISKI